MTTSSTLWEQYTQTEFSNITENFLADFCKKPVGKYLLQTIGLPHPAPAQLQDVFSLGYCTEVLDVFDEMCLKEARVRLLSAYKPKGVAGSDEFEVNGDVAMALFPYFHLVMYDKRAGGKKNQHKVPA